MPHVTRHTSHVTRHTSHATRHTPHVTRHTSHVTRHKSHVTRHTSHVTRHTSCIPWQMSSITCHVSNLNPHCLRNSLCQLRSIRSAFHACISVRSPALCCCCCCCSCCCTLSPLNNISSHTLQKKSKKSRVHACQGRRLSSQTRTEPHCEHRHPAHDRNGRPFTCTRAASASWESARSLRDCCQNVIHSEKGM